MPSSNGVYSLPIGYLAVTGATIQASQHNPPLEDIAAALTGRLSRDGTAAMTGPLQLAVGTVAAPGVAFSTDPTTGLYKTTGGFAASVAGVKVAEFLAGGIVGARLVGEVFDWTGSTAPALCVFPVGQTLSRTTYAALWAFAQVEIAAGNTLYNNGNGSTTFGVFDARGRVRATKNNMGGSDAGLLTSATMTPDGNTLGAAGGAQSVVLTASQVPTITSANASQAISVTSGSAKVLSDSTGAIFDFANTGGSGLRAGDNTTSAVTLTSTGNNSISVTSSNTGGLLHTNMQPSYITNCALFAGA